MVWGITFEQFIDGSNNIYCKYKNVNKINFLMCTSFNKVIKFHLYFAFCNGQSTFYKITKIVGALWLAERRVCMRVCKNGCNHASTNLKKVWSWKTRQVCFIYPFPRRFKLERSLETCCDNFFFAWADILSDKNPYFGKHLFCKIKTDYAYKLRVQDFATGKNFSFNQCSKQESFAFFLGKCIL